MVYYVDKIILKMLEEGHYVVDIKNGNVYSTRTGGFKKLKGHVSNSRGYVRIDVNYDGGRYSCSIHRMVWISKYRMLIPETMVVDHKNDIRTDNRINNLRLLETDKNHWKRKLEEQEGAENGNEIQS